jgi:hypothetical protein
MISIGLNIRIRALVSDLSILLLFGLVLATAVAGIVWSLGQRQRRTRRFAHAAIRLGLSFEQEDRSLLNTDLGELRVLASAKENKFSS